MLAGKLLLEREARDLYFEYLVESRIGASLEPTRPTLDSLGNDFFLTV